MAPQPGQCIAGKYELVRWLARGGMGEVWVARHRDLDLEVAIKLIADQQPAGSHARFEREARAAARLKSPHVAQILDYGIHEGAPYIAMELLDGESLEERLARTGRLSLDEAIAIVQALCLGLERAHEEGIVHRDLKPANIFLARSGRRTVVKILDFGIAKERAGAQITSAGSLLGSPLFMSPEQIMGEAVDHRSDLWSLGVVIYQMLTGVPPFDAEVLAGLLHAICHGGVVPPSQRVPGLPAAVDAFVARALERPRVMRFQSAAELAGAFAALAEPLRATDVHHHFLTQPAPQVTRPHMAHPFPTPAQMPHAASSAFSPTVRPAARSPGCAVAALAAGLLVALALAAGFFALRGAFPTIATTAPDRRALPVSTLDRVTLASTPVAFAESHGGERWKSQVILALDDPAFDRAIFHWASEDADHVDAVGFYLRDGQRMPAGVLDRARAQFGAHLREDNHQLSAPGIALAIEERHVNVSAHDPGLPRHRERMAGLYRALRHIAFGGGRPLALGERRALVNIDHPLAAVGQIPLATPIERAALVMGERFEGAQRQDEFYVVGLDHPWMIAARIRWRDEPGGTLGGAVLLFPAGFDFAAHVSRFDACLEPVLGPRREETKSHAAGRREQVFAARAGTPELRLGGGGVQVLVTSASNDAGWRRLFETLDRCGR